MGLLPVFIAISVCGGGAARPTGADADAPSGADARIGGGGGNQDAGRAIDRGDIDGTPSGESDAAGGAGGGGVPACGSCAAYAPPVMAGRIQLPALNELSGVTTGRRNPDVLFAHNDRDRSDVFALEHDGTLRARVVLAGAIVVDPEDLGAGPYPAGTCLFLADVGDNAASRPGCAILRLAEPAIPAGQSADLTAAFDRFPFTYEDGPHNAEGLLVEPTQGALYVVTKPAAGQPSAIYRLPHPLAAAGNVAVKAATLPVPRAADRQASAAAAHPCAPAFLLRTYDKLYEFRAPPGMTFETAFAATPTELPSATEAQSEGVTYLADGRGHVSGGEGVAAPIFRAGCR